MLNDLRTWDHETDFLVVGSGAAGMTAALVARLEGLESDVARRYRDINELQLMNQLNNLSEKISESSDLSQEEKIQQLKDVLEKIQAMELALFLRTVM